MKNWKKFPRVLFLLTLLISLLAGLSAPALVSQSASAAPVAQTATNVVISEFRTLGTDEFVEIYNPTNSSIDISGWKIKKSSDCGNYSGTPFTFPTSTNIASGQYLLIVGSGYSGSTVAAGDFPSVNFSISDTGGLALTNASDVFIDQVGMCSTTEYKEGATLSELSGTGDKSYERYLGDISDSCQDTGDNSIDFQLISPSNPQNSLTPARLCGGDADLSITQSVDNSTPAVLSNVTFTITVSNAGTRDARSVKVLGIIPAGLTYVSSSATLGSYSNGTGIWSVGTLPNGSNAILSIVATVTTGSAKTISAEVWSSYDLDPDSTPGDGQGPDDYASVTVTPVTTVGLSITNTVNNPNPNVGSNVVFTIIVRNTSASGATGVQVNTTFSAGLDFVSSSPATAAGDLNIGDLNSGASSTFIITARVSSSGTKNLQATVSSNEFSLNSATETVSPVASTQADLSLSQTWSRSTDTEGRVDLKITVVNSTASSATNVQVRDRLPSGLTYVSHTSGMTYSSSTGIWSVGTLDPLASKILTITAKAAVDGDGTTNFAEVWRSDQYDPDSTPANGDIGEDDDTNSAGASVPGADVKVADLSLTQTADIDAAGTNAVFTITVNNGDADDATNVKVSTKLTGYTVLSTNRGIDFIPDAAVGYIWTVESVPANSSRTLIVTTQPVTPGSFPESWAQVSDSTQVDPDSLPGNCENAILTCTEDDDAGAPSADLSLAQVITSPSPYKISDISTKVIFRITITNLGYADATGVQVKDLLPSGLTYSAHVPSTDNYVKGTGLWTIGNLAKNASRTLDITATVSSYGIKTNWAEVWKSGQSDPDSQPGDSSTTDDDDDSQIVISSRSVILNEVAWSGTAASAEDEWIELYNPSKADITLTGWKIKKNGCDTGTDYINLANGGKIAASSYFLLERGATATDNTTVLDVAANQIYLASSTPALLNSGEVLYLCDQNGNIIDTANKNEGNWPKGGGTNYASMERVGNTAESDSVWVSNTGVTKNGKNASGGAIYGTPGAKNSTGIAPTPTPITIRPTAVPIVRPVINEFLARPGYDWNQDGKVDVFDEFIEIKNIGIIDVNLNGWQLDDEEGSGSAPFKIPAAILKPGQRAIFYGLQTNILLGDGGDTVRLINPSGKIYDAYTYALVRLEDQSVCRLPDGGSGWYEDCVPTPNLTNTREGTVPSMPGGEVFESPTCDLPDTLPADFLFAECRGYGADVWRSFYWDKLGWQGDQPIPENMSKWESFVE